MLNDSLITTKAKFQFPLLELGFLPVNCPICYKVCFPTNQTKKGTIRYNLHMCIPDKVNSMYRNTKNRSFGMLDGVFIMPVEKK